MSSDHNFETEGFWGLTGYLSLAFHKREWILKNFTSFMEDFEAPVEGLICTGVSGLLITPMLSDHFKIPFGYLRKNKSSSHSGNLVDGPITPEMNLLMIDDLISTGSTFRRVLQTIKTGGGTTKKFHGVWCYNQYGVPKHFSVEEVLNRS